MTFEKDSVLPRWRIRLEKELAHREEFASFDVNAWRALFRTRSITSRNHDTVLALDWPHYCAQATEACGGARGWCYTFQGRQASELHNRHVAMVDVLARKEPALFAEIVRSEVTKEVAKGALSYPNLRVSGSGEIVEAYVPALSEILRLGVWLWGFTRNLRVGARLQELGVSMIFSCDRTSDPTVLVKARSMGLRLGYSSGDVTDIPPEGTVVTFPVHRVGRVKEVVDALSLCPKVLSEFFYDSRPKAYCQSHCRRCHLKETP